MKHAVYAPNFNDYADPGRLVELAQASEEAGFDGFFIWDHLVFEPGGELPVTDATVALAAIASHTHRLRLGAMITPLARRRPWKVARELVALDWLSQGRVVLGVGLGEPAALEFEAFGEDGSAHGRAGRLDEALTIVDGLVRGDIVAHDGRYYQVEAQRFAPTAKQQPRFPIWVAASLPASAGLRRAARWDGVFPVSMPPDRGLRSDGRIDWSKWWPGVDEFSSMCDTVAHLREARTEIPQGRFDYVASGRLGANGNHGAGFDAYAAAGATWWCHWVDDAPGNSSADLALIARGVPA